MARHVQFYYDVVCPYAYMASVLLPPLAARLGATVQWRPVLLGGIYKATQAPQGAAGSASDVMPASKQAVLSADLRRQLRRLRVPLNWPSAHPIKSLSAMRLLAAVPDALRPSLSARIYKAYWVENRDIAQPSVIGDLLREGAATLLSSGGSVSAGEKMCGVAIADVAKGAFDIEALISHDAAKDALRENTDEAVERGAFGVPSFWVNDELIYGSDRLHFVARALGERDALPPRLAPKPLNGAPREVRFFHDFSSPYSFIASTQIERVASECCAPAANNVKIVWTPILLGAVFRSIGTPNMPMLATPPAKIAWAGTDMRKWLDLWGVSGFRYPDQFPLRTVLPLRVAVMQPNNPRLYAAIYAAAWKDGRDIGKEDVLRDVLNSAGFDAESLMKLANTEEAKERLRKNTDDAVALGVCGVPSFSVNGGPLVWGQDRLNVVADMLCGWEDAPEASRSKL